MKMQTDVLRQARPAEVEPVQRRSGLGKMADAFRPDVATEAVFVSKSKRMSLPQRPYGQAS